ncbi:jg5082 [Pararge aegeria aegeria]|uniref:Jg5082 protein n=1 Tax=Pararge aegeria aegeria TaxID=348720 RepID=A0A8S4QEY1_9NEOP|nr:jg5082 [Pararge aegeria aegeria]
MKAGSAFQILALRITKGRCASYASAVYRPLRDADPYSASRFDGKIARGELDQRVLDHSLRNISYRIPKGRQPCDDVPNSEVFYCLGHR